MRLRVRVHSARENRNLRVTASCRGYLLDEQALTARKGEAAEVTLRPSRGVGGVYRITVFEEVVVPGTDRRQLEPVAERLVYREPAERLQLAIQPERLQYLPGERVTVALSARDEQGRPAAAVLAVRVVDKRVLTLADEKTARTMPAHFLLTTEVNRPEDLEYADFLLSDQPKARLALDLLLGTQGWRRFAPQDPAQPREAPRDDADRLLVILGRSSPRVTELAQKETEQLRREFHDREESLQAQTQEASAAVAALSGEPVVQAAKARLQEYQDWFDRFGPMGPPVLGMLLLILLLVILLRGLPRTVGRAVPLYVGMGACVALLVTLVLVQKDQLGKPWAGKGIAWRPNPQSPTDGGMKRDQQNTVPGNLAVKSDLPPVASRPVPPYERKEYEKKKGVALRHAEEDKMDKAMAKAMAMREGGTGKLAGADHLAGLGRGGPARPVFSPMNEFRGPLIHRASAKPDARAESLLQLPPLKVREYAHNHNRADNFAMRTDFTQTLFWNPALVIGDTGQANISFDLCDSVTGFEIAVYGHTLNGRLGAATGQVEARLPFTLEPKTPIEVTSSDRIDLPVSISNNTPVSRAVTLDVTGKNLALLPREAQLLGEAGLLRGQKNLALLPKEARLLGEGGLLLTVAGNQVTRRVFSFRPEVVEGEATLEVHGRTEPFAADAIARTFRIVPEGFPIGGARSDVLEGVARQELVLPPTWVKGTLKCQVQLFPSTLASLEKGLESLLREPCGCFEQTSTSNYPNVLILGYLKESGQVRPEIEARARALLARGYDKLVSYECPHSGQARAPGLRVVRRPRLCPRGAHRLWLAAVP